MLERADLFLLHVARFFPGGFDFQKERRDDVVRYARFAYPDAGRAAAAGFAELVRIGEQPRLQPDRIVMLVLEQLNAGLLHVVLAELDGPVGAQAEACHYQSSSGSSGFTRQAAFFRSAPRADLF